MNHKLAIPSCASEIVSSCLVGELVACPRHCHGDVAGHLHLPGLFRRLLVGLGVRRHALLFLQLLAAQAEASPRGEAERTVSANYGDGAAQLSTCRIPSSSTSSSSKSTTYTAAQGSAAVLPSSNSAAASSSTGSSSHAASKLDQHARHRYIREAALL